MFGKFVELPRFRPQSINVACDSRLIILINSSTEHQNSVPPNFDCTYNIPVIGDVSIPLPPSDPALVCPSFLFSLESLP
ncbi:MAG: EutP/PduV family microcompartment system protein [Acetobacterium sp.]|nr:EutP/PduV family microcompartment system protein [Acetobacterium sp.]